MKTLREGILLCAIALYLAQPATPQATTATIYGTVQDTSSAVVPEAKVTATNEVTNVMKSTVTDDRGEFTITFLPVGTYTLDLSHTGFKTYRKSGLPLVAGQKASLVFTLEVGAQSDQVTVTAEPPLVNAVTAQQDFSATSQQARELPLQRRDFKSLLNLGTGVVQQAGFGGNVATVVNGLAPSGFGFTIDGTASNQDAFDGSMSLYSGWEFIHGVSVEAIQEVQVTKNIFSAEIGDAISGNVNLITKSGTNELHGSLFENYQAGGLNARNQFLTTKPPLIFHQFGGSLGGPIKKNKLFLFGVFEGYRLTSSQSVNGNVPTTEFRAQAIAAVPAYGAFFSALPLPTAPYAPGSVTGFYQGIGAQKAHENHAVIRGDWSIRSNDYLTLRYTRFRPCTASPMLGSGVTFCGEINTGTVSYTHAASSWSAETRIGTNENDFLRAYLYKQLGVPAIVLTSAFSAGVGSNSGYGQLNKSFGETIGLTRGRHAIKTGGMVQLMAIRHDGQLDPSTYTYGTVTDFLANTPAQASFPMDIKPYDFTWSQVGGFVQDDFRVSPRLTVNLGVRYDHYSVPSATAGRMYNRDGLYGSFLPQNQIYHGNLTDFSPRVGFALKLDNDGKTVLRSGVGVFFTPHRMRGGPAQLIVNDINTPAAVTLSRLQLIADNVSYPAGPSAVLQLIKGTGGSNSTPVINQYFPDPYSIQWTLGVQRQLSQSMVAEISYAANHAVHLEYARDMNQVNWSTGLRPNPGFSQFTYFDSTESSHYESLQASLKKRFSRGLGFDAYYTWSKVISFHDANSTYSTSRAQDLNNLALERGPAPFDRNHRFVTDVLYELPLERLRGASSLPGRLLLRGWQVSSIIIAETGSPLLITEPSTNSGSRPDFVGSSFADAVLSNYAQTLQYLNPAAFAKVPVISVSGATARPGTLGRNAIYGPGDWNIDLSLAKSLYFTERHRLQLRVDMFNSLNHTNLSGIVTNSLAPNFGRSTSTLGARVTQFNARYSF